MTSREALVPVHVDFLLEANDLFRVNLGLAAFRILQLFAALQDRVETSFLITANLSHHHSHRILDFVFVIIQAGKQETLAFLVRAFGVPPSGGRLKAELRTSD
jgi:hypothetical protein